MKNNKQLKKFRSLKLFTLRVLGWLLSFNKDEKIYISDFEPYLDHLELICSKSGLLFMINYHKKVRQSVVNYLAGSDHRPDGIGLTRKDRLPAPLGPLLRVIRNQSPSQMRLVMTLLFCTRALKTEPVLSTESIEEPYKGKVPSSGELGREVFRFWKELGKSKLFRVPRRLKFRSFHFSTKAGPNGPAALSWVQDFSVLDRVTKSALIEMGGWEIDKFFSKSLVNLKHLKSQVSNSFKGNTKVLATTKLSFFSDREGKTRVIAIGDYFSQTVLRYLHRYLFSILRLIPQDCTFDQGKFKNLLEGQSVFYSVDLTSATDRFPIAFISDLLKGHLPDFYVDAWRSVMVRRGFKTPDNRYIRYAVGNPMGFYSSWASFALAHHFVVYLACQKVGVPWKTLPYALLGDDIVIANHEVGEAYIALLDDYGVGVSELKTHKSPDLFEFAKRWIYKGVEISPFPISALRETQKRSYLLTTLLWDLSKREWDFGEKGIINAVAAFYGHVSHLPRRFRGNMRTHASVTLLSLQLQQGLISYGEFLNSLGAVFKYPSSFEEEDSKHYVVGELAAMFRESFTQSEGNPLGKRAMDLLRRTDPQLWNMFKHVDHPITDPGLTYELASVKEDWASNCYGRNPIFDIVVEFSNKYQQLVPEFGPMNIKDWPTMLKACGIPKDDRVFSMEDPDLVTVVMSRLARNLIAKLGFRSSK